MVLVSTIFKALWKMVGLARVGAENLAYCGLEERATGETSASARRKKEKKETYSCVEKAFILHTNCFAEHFVFE